MSRRRKDVQYGHLRTRGTGFRYILGRLLPFVPDEVRQRDRAKDQQKRQHEMTVHAARKEFVDAVVGCAEQSIPKLTSETVAYWNDILNDLDRHYADAQTFTDDYDGEIYTNETKARTLAFFFPRDFFVATPQDIKRFGTVSAWETMAKQRIRTFVTEDLQKLRSRKPLVDELRRWALDCFEKLRRGKTEKLISLDTPLLVMLRDERLGHEVIRHGLGNAIMAVTEPWIERFVEIGFEPCDCEDCKKMDAEPAGVRA